MFEISLCITAVQHVAVEATLEDLGAISISLLDAKNEPLFVNEVNESPLWKYITITALFDKNKKLEHIQTTLEEVLAYPIEISRRNVDHQEWQTSWRQDLQPLRFANRLWVCPSWCNIPDPFAINIRLDPGIAFGTGTHPTTALCLEWLANHPPIDKCVVDFGCGSGILAIATYFLGAKSILAVDHDPQATQATHTNIKRNKISPHIIRVVTAPYLDPTSCELVMANVLLQPLIQLEPQFANSIVATGKIILSGILQQQYEQLEQYYTAHFNIEKIYSKKEWLLIEASRC